MPLFNSAALVAEELLYAFVLFLILFCLFLGLLAKGRVRELLGGFFRLFISFFYCPYVYLRKTAGTIADFGKRREEELARSHHYLGTRITMLLRAALIVAVTGVFAFFVVTGWEAMLPARYLRAAEKNTESQLEREQAQLATISAHLNQLEQDWTNRKDALIEEYRSSKKKQIESLAAANAEVETKLSASPEAERALASLKRYLATDNANLSAAQQYAQMLYTSEDARAELNKYVMNWNQMKVLSRQTESMSPDALRRSIQPDYESTKQNVQYWNAQVSSTSSTLGQLRTKMIYSPENLLISALSGAFLCLLIIWVVGLFLETYTFSTDVMDDIQKLRELAEAPGGRSQAAAGSQR
jgi:hypothetical protein